MNTEKLNEFFGVYETKLMNVVSDSANCYAYGPERVASVVQKMKAAVVAGTYNKDGKAFEDTCRHFGIKHTYTAINGFMV